jgi:hypothetical protein
MNKNMEFHEKANIVDYLQQKGFKLEESGPNNLRLESQDADGICEINIIIGPDSMAVSINRNGNRETSLVKTFIDLLNYLTKQFG